MTIVTYTRFRQNMTHYMDKADDDAEAITITRGKGRSSMLVPMDEYLSLKETAYLLSSKNNRKHLEESMKEAKDGKVVKAPF